MPPSAFGRRLRQLRKEAGLSQAALAARAGLHRQAVARFELGERDPQWRSVLALAAALGVDCRAFQEAPAAKRGRKK